MAVDPAGVRAAQGAHHQGAQARREAVYMSERMVPMSQAQYDVLDRHIIPSLMRAELTEEASQMMTLALAFKWAGEPVVALPENVVELHGYSRKVGA
jgi:hypothetical protein